MNLRDVARRTLRRAQWRDESGLAMFEFALVLPFMLLLYFGMVQLTAYLSAKQRLSSAAAVMADLVTRHRDYVWVSHLNDYFEAAKLMTAGSGFRDIRSRVFVYRPRTGNTPQLLWTFSSASTLTCDQPNAADVGNFAIGQTDLVVAVTCGRLEFPVPAIAGYTLFANPAITVRQQAIMRPRTYLEVNCRDCPTS